MTKTTATAAKSAASAAKPPPGRPVSGRPWKEARTRPASSMVPRGERVSLAKRTEDKRRVQAARALERQIKERDAQAKRERRLREEENKKRKEENEAKSEVVQVIRNASKIKRLTKKQMRNIKQV
eukprot:m51a1_g13230 hypothetical protein (125) ;mRNA; f:429-943